MELTLLVPDTAARYSLERPPGLRNPGGGVGIKYARMEQMLSQAYHVQRTSQLELVDTDFVIVEPLWFSWIEDARTTPAAIDTRLKAFLERMFRNILVCGSEHELYLWPYRRKQDLMTAAHWITHNSTYQRHLFQAAGIPNSRPLSDPVPEHVFYPSIKQNRIYAASHISWQKNTKALIELYRALQDTDIETVYAGSAQTWGDDPSEVTLTDRYRLEAELREVTDIFLGDVPPHTVAYYGNAAQHHIQVAHHDTCCQNQQEAALAGATLWGLNHPINTERPVNQFQNIDTLAAALIEQNACPPKVNTTVRDYALKHFSYSAVLAQFHEIIRSAS